MIEFDRWAAGRPFGDRTDFVVLGKGPTYARRSEFDLTGHVQISLNHVVAQQPVDIAHMIDFDVAEACADSIAANARWLLMPRHPHLQYKATLLSLDELIQYVPTLAALEEEGRIVCYDLEGAGGASPSLGTNITAQYFSSEAAVDLAGHLGARKVSTLGIDGGTRYAGNFASLANTTRLANGQPSFSIQFERLDEIARRHGITVEPLVQPLKVYVGVQERELIAARVLAFSINEHASQPVQVVHLHPVKRLPVDARNRQRTPFSFSRFLIPELNGYEGRALYVDSDMQVFDDITTLWSIPFDGAKVLCTDQKFIPPQWRGNPDFHPGRQMSVMMLDCGSLAWNIDEIIDGLDSGQMTYEDLMFKMTLVPDDQVRDGLPEGWNHLEHFVPGETKLLHYTAVPTQPWKTADNPNVRIWEDAFIRACEAGYIDAELVEKQIEAGHVRPSLRSLVPPVQEPAPTVGSVMAAELAATRAALARATSRRPRVIARKAVSRLRREARRRLSR